MADEKKLSIALLTTDTPHHRFIADRIAKSFPLASIVLETTFPKAPFEVSHPYEKTRDEWEKKNLLHGNECELSSYARITSFENINCPAAVEFFSQKKFDIAIVAGCRKICPEVLDVMARIRLNMHGGVAERYRGLDSLFWSIYHDDFKSLACTLHLMDSDLDTGEIINVASIPLHKDMKIEELRAASTATSVDLCLHALQQLIKTGSLTSRKQNQKGRYYSYMPTVLKEICIKKFHKHTEKLK